MYRKITKNVTAEVICFRLESHTSTRNALVAGTL